MIEKQRHYLNRAYKHFFDWAQDVNLGKAKGLMLQPKTNDVFVDLRTGIPHNFHEHSSSLSPAKRAIINMLQLEVDHKVYEVDESVKGIVECFGQQHNSNYKVYVFVYHPPS